VWCSVVQCVAVQHTATHCHALQHTFHFIRGKKMHSPTISQKSALSVIFCSALAVEKFSAREGLTAADYALSYNFSKVSCMRDCVQYSESCAVLEKFYSRWSACSALQGGVES